ncbi:MAG: hypothetical protein P4L84_34465 [Isosphaeraceae bacterium]|nr:hypothetical protein [Isosphaeraceae bacterium]
MRKLKLNPRLWRRLWGTRATKDRVWTGGSLAENFYVKLGYASRQNPEYYFDEPAAGVTWQPMVYPFAAERAVQRGCDTIVDIGCGRAQKLARLWEEHPSWKFIGIDYGNNIQWCTNNHKFGTWIESDLEKPGSLIKDRDLEKALVICSDVVEHLVFPGPLLDRIHLLLEQGAREAIISTPERDLTRGIDDFGPPKNSCHVREWNSQEFRALLEAWKFRVDHLGLTRSNDAEPHERTILAVVSRQI